MAQIGVISIGKEVNTNICVIKNGKIHAYFISPNSDKTKENIDKLLEKLIIKKCKEIIETNK